MLSSPEYNSFKDFGDVQYLDPWENHLICRYKKVGQMSWKHQVDNYPYWFG